MKHAGLINGRLSGQVLQLYSVPLQQYPRFLIRCLVCWCIRFACVVRRSEMRHYRVSVSGEKACFKSSQPRSAVFLRCKNGHVGRSSLLAWQVCSLTVAARQEDNNPFHLTSTLSVTT